MKGGSYNGQYFDGGAPISAEQIPYDAEVLLSYEGGFKLTGPGGAYTLNGGVFHYNYSDYQSFNFSNLVGTVSNVDATITGVELAASARLGGLRASASGSYLDAEVPNFSIAPGVFRDTTPAYTPEFSASGRLDYTVPGRLAGGELTLGSGVTYRSSVFHNARNFEASKLDSYFVVDVNADITFENGFSAGAFVRNLFDERYATVGLDLTVACGCVLSAYGQPVTWGFRAGYRF